MAEIVFKNVSKSFDQNKVIEDLDLTIKDGDFTVLVGASGCGKTTLLRMIAGIGNATSGHIYLDNTDITDLAPSKRGIAMVFQNYAIYPTMTVRENIEFGLKNNKVPKAERDALIAEYSEIVGLTDYLDRKPSTLSGGQRQRVALARAMVKKPKVFLMDEPLSNLDAKLRVAMRSELIQLHKRLKTTFVYVTRDQVEAMSMADTIILMDKGKIQQEASPEEIYKNPNNIFTAQFIGTPPMNIIKQPGENSMGFRPEDAVLGTSPSHGGFSHRVSILTREMLGSEVLYMLDLSGSHIMIKCHKDADWDEGELFLHVHSKDLYFFDAQGKRVREEENPHLFAECREAAEGMSRA